MSNEVRAVKRHGRPLLIWTLLCGLFFVTILVGTERLPTSDLTEQFHAFATFQAREMLAGRLPVWSPGSYGGIPFAADPQAAVFYPPRWLTILLSAPWRFPFYALEVEGIVHIWLAGTFAYGLACAITGRRWPGLIAAVAFGLGGYLTSFPLLQLAVLESAAWLPLALLFVRLGVRRPRFLVGAGLALAMSLAAGHPQTALHAAYLTAAYFIFCARRSGWRWTAVLGYGGLIGGTALGAAAVTWLPALRFMLWTTRGAADYAFVSAGEPLLNFAAAVGPGVLAAWSPEYSGLTVLILAVFAWLGRQSGDRAEVLFWVVVGLLAAWLSLGDRGVLFELAYRVAPGFSLFRRQERLLGVVSLSAAVLAAQGAALWLRLATAERQRLLRQSALVGGAALALVGVIYAVTAAVHLRPWLPIWGRQVGLLGLALAVLWWGRGRPLALAALAALLTIDLYLVNVTAVTRQTGSPAVYWPDPAWTAALDDAGVSRLDSQGLFNANIGEVHGWEDVRGISPLKPAVLARLEALPRPLRWQLLNVTHVTAWPDELLDEPLTAVAEIDEGLVPDRPRRAVLYRFDQPLPRAWLVYDAVAAPDAEAAFELLRAGAVRPATTAVLHPPLPDLSRLVGEDGSATAAATRPRPNALRVEVETATPGLLVISEWRYPGWRATLDGGLVETFPANDGFTAVFVPAGRHTIELTFVPMDVIAGAVVSLLALTLAAALLRRWRPSPSREVPARRRESGRARTAVVPGRRFSRWWPVGLLLLGFGLRLFTAGAQELRGDEAFSVRFATPPPAAIVERLLAVGETHSPFHFWALHGWMALVGRGELALRMQSILLGTLLLALGYQLGRRMGGRSLGLLVMGLTAVSQLAIWISQDVRNMYSWAPVLGLAATLLLLEAAERRPFDQPRTGRTGWWTLYALTAALTVYSHYYGAFVLIGHGFFLWFDPARRRSLRPWLLSGLAAALLFIPWLLILYPSVAAAGHLSDPDSPDLAQHIVRLGRELAVGNAYDRPSGRWLFVGGLLLAGLGAARLKERRPGWAAFLLGWLGSAVLFLYLIRFHRATFNFFYIILAAPAWWALIAVGWRTLWRRWRGAAVVAGLAILVSSGWSLGNYYFDPVYNRTLGYRPIAAQVAAARGPDDLFIANFPDPSLRYYLEDVPIRQEILPATFDVPPAATEAALADLAAQHERIWIVPAAGSNWDPEGVVLNWLENHALLEWNLAYEKLELRGYRPPQTLAEVMTPVDAVLEDESGRPLLQLKSAFVTIDGAPAELGAALAIRPGATAQVTLLWEALAKIPSNYTVFVHLLDGERLLAQHDGLPFFGQRPTFLWQPGELILDRHELVIPAGAAGETAVLQVGLYDAETVERVRFADGRNALPLADVVIGR